MLCDICKKNEATIHIKEISGNKQKTMNLCSKCAAERENSPELPFGAFNLAELLYNIGKMSVAAGVKKQSSAGADESADGVTCPECGWTQKKLREAGGKLGCAKCYHTFGQWIDEAIGHVHKGTVHIGRRPDGRPSESGVLLQAELIKKRHELELLIKSENYEQAAVVRDRIRELEAGLTNKENIDDRGE